MSDFDDIKKQVDDLQSQHRTLIESIPVLDEQHRGLIADIQELQAELVSQQQAIEEAREKATEIITDAREERDKILTDYQKWMDKETLAINEKHSKADKELRALNLDKEKFLDEKLAIQQELQEERDEIAQMAQRTTESEISLLTESTELQNRWSEINQDAEKLKADRRKYEADLQELNLLKATVANAQAGVADDTEKLERMTAEVLSTKKAATAMLKEAKERDNLISLKADEYHRKEKLLDERKAKLDKREIALNDRAAIYDSRS